MAAPARTRMADEQQSHAWVEPTRVVHVANLSRSVTVAHLAEIAGKYGEVEWVEVQRDGTGLSKGVAHIVCADVEAAIEVVAHLDGGQIDGHCIKLNFSHDHRVFDRPLRPIAPAPTWGCVAPAPPADYGHDRAATAPPPWGPPPPSAAAAAARPADPYARDDGWGRGGGAPY